MFCKKCGKEIADDCKVCPYCMTPTVEEPESVENTDSTEKAKKIIIIVCAAVVVIGLIVTAFMLGRHQKNPADDVSTNSSALSASDASDAADQTTEQTETTKTTTATTTTAKPEIVPTGSDWDNLTGLSEKIYFNDFNCKSASMNDVFEILYFSLRMPLYDDLISEIKYSDESFTISVKNFNWLVKNVFNVEPKTVDSLIAYEETAGYRSGDNYVINSGAIGYEIPIFEIKSKDKNSDGNYDVVLNVYMDDLDTGERMFIGTISATVKLKEVDGKRFWSFYSIKNNID